MGLKHIPQLIWLDQYPIGTPLGGGPFPQGNEDFGVDGTLWYLFMEYLPHGDLRELLHRLNEREEEDPLLMTQIPARLMWRIFLCREYIKIGPPAILYSVTQIAVGFLLTYFQSLELVSASHGHDSGRTRQPRWRRQARYAGSPRLRRR